MKARTKFALCFVLMCSLQPAFSQYQVSRMLEFGFWLGGSNYVGDINATAENYWKIFRPAGGVYNRININDRLALKTSFNYGQVTGADSFSDNAYELARNLSFKSHILEAATQFEFNFFRYEVGNPTEYYFTPYLFLGISVFNFSPKGYLNGDWYELSELGTEGQLFPQYSGNERYKLTQIAIPVGMGFKYSFGESFTLGFEVGYRKTYTDYMDDVSKEYVDPNIISASSNGYIASRLADRSPEVMAVAIGEAGIQRGDTRRTDAFIFTGLSISYTFKKQVCFSP